MKFWLFVLLFAVVVCAQKAVNEFSSPKYTADELFSKLDAVGNNGNWMEFDASSIEDPSVNTILKKHPKAKAVWGIADRGKFFKLAVLNVEKNLEWLRVYELKGFDAKPMALAVNSTLYPETILADYRGVAENEFVHRDESSLKIRISNKSIHFYYEKPDAVPLHFDDSFKTRSAEEKREIVSEYVDFFKYEYSLMVRAFVQSTRGIFNWQAWHWYMPEWYGRYFITSEEIAAILSANARPSMFTIFKAKTNKNVVVEMRADGNGHYEMSIETP